jgi:hypothetical protein
MSLAVEHSSLFPTGLTGIVIDQRKPESQRKNRRSKKTKITEDISQIAE